MSIKVASAEYWLEKIYTVLAVQRISGTTESFYGVMGWGESI